MVREKAQPRQNPNQMRPKRRAAVQAAPVPGSGRRRKRKSARKERTIGQQRSQQQARVSQECAWIVMIYTRNTFTDTDYWYTHRCTTEPVLAKQCLPPTRVRFANFDFRPRINSSSIYVLGAPAQNWVVMAGNRLFKKKRRLFCCWVISLTTSR